LAHLEKIFGQNLKKIIFVPIDDKEIQET